MGLKYREAVLLKKKKIIHFTEVRKHFGNLFAKVLLI